MDDDGSTLWSDGTRFFVIPDAATLTEGPLELRDSFGVRRHVAEVAIVDFEVTPDEAGARLLDRVRRGLGVKKAPVEVWTRDDAGNRHVDVKIEPTEEAVREGLRALWSGLKPSLIEAIVGLPRAAITEGPRNAVAAVGERLMQVLASPQLQQLLRVAGASLTEEARSIDAAEAALKARGEDKLTN